MFFKEDPHLRPKTLKNICKRGIQQQLRGEFNVELGKEVVWNLARDWISFSIDETYHKEFILLLFVNAISFDIRQKVKSEYVLD